MMKFKILSSYKRKRIVVVVILTKIGGKKNKKKVKINTIISLIIVQTKGQITRGAKQFR